MQLQSVPPEPPGEPQDPGDGRLHVGSEPANIAAAALAARGVVLISGRLTDDAVHRVTAQVLTHDGGNPLEIHLMNVTGSVRKALMLHDVVAGADPPPHVTGSGGLDTAGALVLAAGRRGRRTLMPNATIHLSRIDPLALGDDDGDLAHLRLDAESAAAEAAAIKRHAEEILGYDLERPRLFRADEAVTEGLADEISLKRK